MKVKMKEYKLDLTCPEGSDAEKKYLALIDELVKLETVQPNSFQASTTIGRMWWADVSMEGEPVAA